MTNPVVLLALTLFTFSVKAQSIKTDTNQVRPYGNVDTSELNLKSCGFEKDANAMVLFDKADIKINWDGAVSFMRHKRIKIFNTNGKDNANIDLSYFDKITDLVAETVNLTGGKIEYTQVDPQLIYKQKVNKEIKNLTFAFPDVRAGSVIEIQYTWKLKSLLSIPPWFFQSDIPVRYSKVNVEMDNTYKIKLETVVNQFFAEDTVFSINHDSGTKAILILKNIHSFVKEPHMTPEFVNLQRVSFKSKINWWERANISLVVNMFFGGQLDFPLKNEKAIIKKADSIKNNDDKIDSIFTLVKDSMRFNGINHLYVDDPAQDAWNNRKGSSTEINMILCRLLKSAGIEAYPMLISTPDYGVADPTAESLFEFNKCVVMVSLDTTHYYTLDASNKHNVYNRIPLELLNTAGFIVMYKKNYGIVYLRDSKPSQQLVSVKADILADGKLNGTVEVTSNDYNRDADMKNYHRLGKKDYIKSLTGGNNALKISALTIDNMETDSLPLTQHFNFSLDLPSSDGNYIYFTPYMFKLDPNPFLSEKRFSDIDFTYNNTYTITGTYTIPKGYKIESLPQNQLLTLADKSMSVKRVFEASNDVIQLHYIISRKKLFYHKEEYKSLHDFYKKMYEMLNEQIVLKKS
ncbi:DUF3857 domain-containing protein [Mucilaginibacter sp. L196]|uniref:DUF3857 domain-containing protein n=1 Tax=Mucilaginibacter sp. L196 TaxID=1641870 RepID=UPI00131AA903|nr:DUF3857 domain-containing protein [Mucilaginibacter sp. L196]